MRFPHNTKIFRGQLEAAPFIGVFFLLVIFLLLANGMVFVPGVPIELPEGVNLPGLEGPTASVAVDVDGHFYFESQLCDEEQLRQRLQAVVERTPEPLTLIAQVDQRAKAEAYLRLGVLARSVGIRKMWWAARPPVVPVPR
jgi:biopolymer transport protein ExbD